MTLAVQIASLSLPALGWALLFLALVWSVRAARTEDVASSLGWKWWLVVALLVLCFRWPMLWIGHALNPDESQLIAGAITLRHDPVFWRSVDGGTAGPVDFYPLLPSAWLDGFSSYVAARLIALGVMVAAMIFAGEALAVLAGAALARVALLPLIAAVAFTTDPDFAHYSTELMPALLLAAAGYVAVRHAEKSSSRDSGESRSRAVEGSSSSSVVATEGGNFERPKRAGLNSSSGPLDPSTQPLWLIGLLLGSVPWAKLQATPIAAALWVFVAFREFRAGRARGLISLFAAALLPALICFGIVAVTGQSEHLIVPYFVHNFGYIDTPQFPWRESIAGQWENALTDGYLGFWFAGAVLFLVPLSLWAGRRAPATARQVALAATLLFAVALFSALAPRRLSVHHLLLIPLPLFWLTGCILALAWPRESAGPASRTRLLVASLLLVCCLIPQIALRATGYNPFAAMNAATDKPTRRQLVMLVRTLSDPGEPLGIWGWRCGLYVEAGRRQATRQAQTEAQIYPSPLRPYFLRRYLEDFIAANPPVFADAVGPGNFAYGDRAVAHESFPLLRRWIQDHFTQIADLDGTRLYVRNDRLAARHHLIFPSNPP